MSEEIGPQGGRALSLEHDPSPEAVWNAVIAGTSEAVECLDVLVNNAGIGGGAKDTPLED